MSRFHKTLTEPRPRWLFRSSNQSELPTIGRNTAVCLTVPVIVCWNRDILHCSSPRPGRLTSICRTQNKPNSITVKLQCHSYYLHQNPRRSYGGTAAKAASACTKPN